MITVAFRGSDKTDDGVSASECARTLTGAGADIVGVNCMRDQLLVVSISIVLLLVAAGACLVPAIKGLEPGPTGSPAC